MSFALEVDVSPWKVMKTWMTVGFAMQLSESIALTIPSVYSWMFDDPQVISQFVRQPYCVYVLVA